MERTIANVLDSLCPKLKSSRKLQSKALRCVFSIGIDAVVLDSECSAQMGKLTLRPEDFLSSDDSHEVFGSFMMPDLQELRNKAEEHADIIKKKSKINSIGGSNSKGLRSSTPMRRRR